MEINLGDRGNGNLLHFFLFNSSPSFSINNWFSDFTDDCSTEFCFLKVVISVRGMFLWKYLFFQFLIFTEMTCSVVQQNIRQATRVVIFFIPYITLRKSIWVNVSLMKTFFLCLSSPYICLHVGHSAFDILESSGRPWAPTEAHVLPHWRGCAWNTWKRTTRTCK